MNYLTDDFPFEIDGIAIDTDFRRMVQFELLMYDDTVPMAEKLFLAVNLLYKKPVQDLKKAWDGLLWYYSCGRTRKNRQGSSAVHRANRAYDFETDAERIYIAFISRYGIDLQKTPLHWWAFHALLVSLPDSCSMGRLMYYRTVDINSLKGEERKQAAKIRSMYPVRNIEQNLTRAQRDARYLARIEKREKELQKMLKERE